MISQNVLVLGSGAREHAIAWKLDQSPLVQRVFIAPGNACKYSVADADASTFKTVEGVLDFCARNSVSMVVIGPEKEICAGWADKLSEKVKVFAPSGLCARLEASKSFAKQFMCENNLPTAAFQSFSTALSAINFVKSVNWSRIVIKEDGLCAGKGVSIANTEAEAIAKIQEIFAHASETEECCVVVEEFLDGFEVSAMCFTDGVTISQLPLSQDHKRAMDGDLGANTGGMGAVAPIILSHSMNEKITEILQITVDAFNRNNTPYRGIIYAGLMITTDGPKILEYNCRFGDPETEVLLRLLESDLFEIMRACVDGNLAKLPSIKWSPRFAVGIVVASKGYPQSFPSGLTITNIPNDDESLVTFLGGVKYLADKRNGTRKLVNSGGRVLCVTCLNYSPFAAKSKCLNAIDAIQFELKYFRRDIGHFLFLSRESLTYCKSGVNVEEGNAFVEKIKEFCKLTLTPGTQQIGGFGAVIDLSATGFSAPSSHLCGSTQLVVGMDGVGTKLEIADRVGDFSGLGFDLVGMCANDVLCHAARPLAFLDYYVTGKLQQENAVKVIESIANACLEAECALIGGETAEMPGVYKPKQWDIAGCCIGARQSDWPQLPLKHKITVNDRLIGIASNGLHSNGFSLVRKVLDESALSMSDACPWDKHITLGSELLKPTKIYVKALLNLAFSGKIRAMAHITGGGIVENLPRCLPENLSACIDCSSWFVPKIFVWLCAAAAISPHEMLKTFNCGIGMILVVAEEFVEEIVDSLRNSSTQFFEIGTIIHRKPNQKQIKFDNIEKLFPYYFDNEFVHRLRVNVGILISGAGSNMVELIKQSRRRGSHCHVGVVISNRADARGLELARSSGVEAIVVPSQGKSRHDFEADVCKELKARGVELICLAGFMRLLTEDFIRRWPRRIINVHPSLLPSFRGAHAVRLALEAGVKVSGCTVHYVVEEMDAGEILAQEVVCVEDDDDEKSLHAKIQIKEHTLFPKTMEQVAQSILTDKHN